MEAIATLLNDDPYLKLSAQERTAARKTRLANIAARAKPEKPLTVPAFIEKPKTVLQEEAWVDRQRRLHPPIKTPWFYIVDEIGAANSTIEDIQRAVCKYYNITRDDMISDRRNHYIVVPRHVAIYLSKIMTLRSLSEMGRRFGGRDHATMMHAVKRITRLMQIDKTIANDIEQIKAQL